MKRRAYLCLTELFCPRSKKAKTATDPQQTIVAKSDPPPHTPRNWNVTFFDEKYNEHYDGKQIPDSDRARDLIKKVYFGRAVWPAIDSLVMMDGTELDEQEQLKDIYSYTEMSPECLSFTLIRSRRLGMGHIRNIFDSILRVSSSTSNFVLSGRISMSEVKETIHHKSRFGIAFCPNGPKTYLVEQTMQPSVSVLDLTTPFDEERQVRFVPKNESMEPIEFDLDLVPGHVYQVSLNADVRSMRRHLVRQAGCQLVEWLKQMVPVPLIQIILEYFAPDATKSHRMLQYGSVTHLPVIGELFWRFRVIRRRTHTVMTTREFTMTYQDAFEDP